MDVKNVYDDYCHECIAYGDDYYWDEEIKDYVNNCDTCPFNDLKERWRNKTEK